MREILFRGKRIDNGKWVEGEMLHDMQDRPYIYWKTPKELPIVFSNHAIVRPETVGQFTGLTDKNGKKIFEGDIVRGRHWTSYNNKNPEDFHSWRVDWSEKSGLITFADSPTTKARLSIHDFADFGEVEVIGNIHDNPELLEVNDNA